MDVRPGGAWSSVMIIPGGARVEHGHRPDRLAGVLGQHPAEAFDIG
ncbi:Uncharacterised protein [Mycobacterium tuberculosis]|nr:Uncharacterised protein [Mycobacterium tuberculosis]